MRNIEKQIKQWETHTHTSKLPKVTQIVTVGAEFPGDRSKFQAIMSPSDPRRDFSFEAIKICLLQFSNSLNRFTHYIIAGRSFKSYESPKRTRELRDPRGTGEIAQRVK